MEAESFVLLSVENREILGVEPSHLNPEAAIVTVQNQGVYIYDVFDQQCKTSYLLAPGNSFTYHAVQNPNTKKFLAVKDNKYLCSWPEEQKDLKKIGRKAYDRGAIHSVWVDKFLSSHHLIVFADGVLALGNPDLALMANQESAPVGSPGEVVWASLRRADSLLFVAVVTKATNDNYSLHIHSITRPEKALELSHLSSHKLAKPQKSKMLTCAFDADALSFTALWSTGDLNVWTVPSVEDLTNVNDSFQIAVSRKLKLPKSTASAPNGGVTAISIKANLLLLTQPAESSKQPKQTLMMWDTTFGVVQSTKDISTDAEAQKTRGAVATSDAAPLAVLQASQSTDNSLVFLNLGSMVVVCPVWAPSSSLANALGRLEASKPFLVPQQHAAVEHQNIDWLAPVLKSSLSVADNKPASADDEDADEDDETTSTKPVVFKNSHVEKGFAISDLDKLWQEHAGSNLQAEANIIATLKNKSKTPTFEAFMNVFTPYITERKETARQMAKSLRVKLEKGHWKNIAELSNQRSKRKKKMNLNKMLRESISFLSHNFVVQVAQRCLEEDFLWQPLRVLIESRSLPVRSIPNFLLTLMEKNQHVRTLTEADVFLLLFSLGRVILSVPCHWCIYACKCFTLVGLVLQTGAIRNTQQFLSCTLRQSDGPSVVASFLVV
eukprot:TRINITY_DN1960_c1_g1_i2.p1 TRINITY_DN1960_c1_g1~~TRINITY_DN1960_c1_g1_i2.p1  ORF type:complete len:665 (+),score=151.33 TRINITY_DN1960_c1_g1_i2:110-2104(+)